MCEIIHNSVIKTAPFVKTVKSQRIALSKSKCTQSMCSTTYSCLIRVLVLLKNFPFTSYMYYIHCMTITQDEIIALGRGRLYYALDRWLVYKVLTI